MVAKQATLKIELRSDLCSGSGLSYAGVIDSDVVYDEYGFPYIPARRMKGCLREAAEMVGIEEKTINYLFGERGANAPGSLQIGNAVLEKAEKLEKEIDDLKKEITGLKQDKTFTDLLTPENILGVYTSVRAQTRIDRGTGSAEDNTLRFTRVVNQYDPLADAEKHKHLCFFADVFWQADSEDCLSQIARATRNIGINRNRGLGSVRCDLINVKSAEENKRPEQDDLICAEECGNGIVKISYVLENTAPLVLSEDDESGTSSHISGKSVLGALAGAYLREKRTNNKGNSTDLQNPADTDEFRDLFLNGTVKYANAYPVVENLRAYPAPLYLNKLKKTKCYINKLGPKPAIKQDEEIPYETLNVNQSEKNQKKEDPFNTSNGNQPKLLKTEYVAECFDGDGKISYHIAEPEKEMAYHHRHSHGEEAPEDLLYTLEYLKRGQQFAGVIYAPENYKDCLCHLLTTSKLRFGKSRAAQYGTCKLVPYFLSCESNDKAQDCKGEEMVVTLKSDTIFMNEKGCYTVCFTEVKKLLADALGIKYDSQYVDDKSAIQTKEVVGYNTTWNMKRAAGCAVSAGSAFVYKLAPDDAKEYKWPTFVGERTQEGFGEIEIHPLSLMEYEAKIVNESVLSTNADIDASQEKRTAEGQREGRARHEDDEAGCSKITADDIVLIICKLLREPLIEQLMMSKKLGDFHKLNSTNIGRITLMLKESLDASDTPDHAANDFWKRIRSIKSDYGKVAERLAEKTTKKIPEEDEKKINAEFAKQGNKENDENRQYEIDPDKLDKLVEDASLQNALKKLPKESKNNLLKDIWGEFMLQYLTQLKYDCKEG